MHLFPMTSPMALFALALAAATPLAGHAHPKGLFDSQQEAEQRAKELDCTGTHQNSGKWMPCSTEATLHQHLRHH